MSTELLINFDKTTSNTASRGTSSIKNSESKKEGNSLFDSLMNEAKVEKTTEQKNTEKSTEQNNTEKSSKQKNTEKSTEQNDTEKSSEQKNIGKSSEQKNIGKSSEQKNIGKSVEQNDTEKSSKLKNIEKSVDQNDTEKFVDQKNTEKPANYKSEKQIITETKIITSPTQSVLESTIEDKAESKKNLSIKKLVDKLVDIVVNAAKDMFDKNDVKTVNGKELKNAVEEIVEIKLSKIADKDKLKSIIDKKLDIVNDSVDIIKNEVKNVISNKEQTDNNGAPTIQSKKSKEIIKNEVIIIKDNVKEIKKDVALIVIKEESNVKVQKIDLKDIEKNNTDEIKVDIKDKIDNKLSIIDESTDEISTIISKVDLNVKDSTSKELLRTIDNKVEFKVDTIKDAIVEIKEKVLEIVIVKTTGNEIKKQDSFSPSNIIKNADGIEHSEKSLLASMFLNNQKSIKSKTSLGQIHDAKTNIINNKTVESVKVSANKLDLKIEDTEVKHENEQGKKPVSLEKKEELKTNNLINNRELNKVLINQRVEANYIKSEHNNTVLQKEVISNNESEKRNNLEIVELNVPKDIVQNLQNRIIGAQQKMGSFMSEVARNMYLNYKPPVTAFRVNLNPANLGSISIIMKANKVDNSLSVSMNLSNSNTMEAFTENKALLQNAIQRQFNESSNVSINFNMQDQNSENSFSQFNQNNDNKNKEENKNNSTSENNLEEQEIIENNDYM